MSQHGLEVVGEWKSRIELVEAHPAARNSHQNPTTFQSLKLVLHGAKRNIQAVRYLLGIRLPVQLDKEEHFLGGSVPKETFEHE